MGIVCFPVLHCQCVHYRLQIHLAHLMSFHQPYWTHGLAESSDRQAKWDGSHCVVPERQLLLCGTEYFRPIARYSANEVHLPQMQGQKKLLCRKYFSNHLFACSRDMSRRKIELLPDFTSNDAE